jgi:hypothetical protein
LSKRLIVLFAGVVAIAVIAAGCGSSSDESTETTAALTKAEFIKQGDAICEKCNKHDEAEFESFAKEHELSEKKEPTKAQQEELVTDVVLPSISKQAEELRELGVPSGDEDAVNGILDGLDEAIEKAEDAPTLVLEGQGPFVDVNKQAKEYGFEVCGQQ